MVAAVNNLINNPPPISNNPVYERICGIKKDFVTVGKIHAKEILAKEARTNFMLDMFLYSVFGAACFGSVFAYKKTKNFAKEHFAPQIEFIKNSCGKINNYSEAKLTPALQACKQKFSDFKGSAGQYFRKCLKNCKA